MLLNNNEKANLLVTMNRFYQWQKQGRNKHDKNAELFQDICKGKKNFGNWKSIYDEMKESENKIENFKQDIIFLKNNVLYNYDNKEKAIKTFVDLKTELLKENENLKSLYDYYFTNVEMIANETDVQKLTKLYNENMLVYKNKMRIANVSDLKKKQKLIAESVQLSIFLNNLSEQIRAKKYQVVYVLKENGINLKPLALEKTFRVFKDDNFIQFASKK
jgi:DNA transporter